MKENDKPKTGKIFISDPDIDVEAKQHTLPIDRRLRYLIEISNAGNYTVSFKDLRSADILAAMELVRNIIKQNIDSLNSNEDMQILNEMDPEYREALISTIEEVDRELLMRISHHFALKVIKENSTEMKPTLKVTHRK